MRLYITLAFLVSFCFCEDVSEYTLNPSNGNEYRIVYEAETFDDAIAKCREEKAILAVPQSEDEFKFLQEMVHKMQFRRISNTEYKHLVWLGIENRENYKVWKTVEGKTLEESGFNTWSGNNGNTFSDDPKEPHCAGMDSTNPGLRDWWCHRAQPFICQKKSETSNKV